MSDRIEVINGKTVFLDTFALGKIARNSALAHAMQDYIRVHDYTLVISAVNLTEIYPRPSLWTPVAEFIASVPFCVTIPYIYILSIEVLNYPNAIKLPVGFWTRNYKMTEAELKSAIEANLTGTVSKLDNVWREEKLDIWQSLINNKKTFPPEQNGKYSEFQKWLFLQTNVIKFLLLENRTFVNTLKTNGEKIEINCFKSVYILVLAIFLEYYVQNKNGKASDIGDFVQLSFAPYVDLNVFDNERNALLQKINRLATPLGKIQSYNLKQFTELVNKG